MNLNKRITLLGFFLLLMKCSFISAQQPTALTKFETFTIDDGLAEGFVNSIIQDKQGFMWFATWDGLNRYDGYHYTVYRHNEKDTHSIISNVISQVFEDSKGRLWVQTWYKGLDYFDRAHQRFYHFLQQPNAVNQSIDKIYEDKQGNLWTDLHYVDTKDNTVVRIHTSPSQQEPGFIVDTMEIHLPGVNAHVMSDNEGNVFGISTTGIYKITTGKKTFSLQPLFTYNSAYLSPTLTQDPVTHKWYVRLNGEILEFNNSSFKNPKSILQSNANFCFADGNGHLWLRHLYSPDPKDLAYLSQFDLSTHKVQEVIPANAADTGFLEYIYSAYRDKAGNVWFGTSGVGIIKWSVEQNRFHLILNQQMFGSLYKIFDSGVQVTGGMRLWLKKGQGITTEISSPGLKTEKMSGTFFSVDSAGYFWGANESRILLKKDPYSQKTIESFSLQNSTNPTLQNLIKQAKLYDSALKATTDFHMGWFYANSNLVWLFFFNTLISCNTITKQFTVYPTITQGQNPKYFKDKAGLVWVSTKTGCSKINAATGEVQSYKFKQAVSSFCDDPLQPLTYIWIGTDNGLLRMNKATGVYHNFFNEKGFPNGIVNGILSDAEGNLWMSSNNGLYRLHVSNMKIEVFDASDNLQSTAFDIESYLKMDDGTLFFGGTKGLNYFKPEEIKPLSPPSAFITDFKIFGKSVNYKAGNASLKQDITYTKNITAGYRDNIITFEFAGDDYSKKQRLQYRYKLQGFDNNWNYSGINNTATYTNLDPGNYTFIAEASNTNDVWGTSSQPLQIHITPLWWQTWLFKILVALIIIVSSYLLYRYRLLQALKVERVRNRIASDLHDEIGSTLSTLSIYSKIVQNQLQSEEHKTAPLVEKISDNTTQAMEAMSDIVWSVNSKNDKFENIITRMQNIAVQVLEAKSYKVHFNTDERIRSLNLKMEKRRDFYLIFKESINNIAKHAQGKNVWINFSEKGNYIVMNIKDDGIGFDENNIRKDSNGMHNLKERAAAIDGKISVISSQGNGTTIELSFLYN